MKNLQGKKKKLNHKFLKDDKEPKAIQGSEKINVSEYMNDIDKERSRRLVCKEFAEDDFLFITNHKRRWKNTLSKRVQRMLKVKQMDSGDLKMN